MAKRHQSFLVRCWQLDRGGQRIEIEHIQSGQRHLAHSTAEASEWICARMNDPPRSLPGDEKRSDQDGSEA